MPIAPQVIPQSPPPPTIELALREEGGVFPLNDDLVMDVSNISFNKFQRRIVQAWRNHFLDDRASLGFIRENVIVSDTKKHPNFISEANLAYAGATRSNIQYLTTEND